MTKQGDATYRQGSFHDCALTGNILDGYVAKGYIWGPDDLFTPNVPIHKQYHDSYGQ